MKPLNRWCVGARGAPSSPDHHIVIGQLVYRELTPFEALELAAWLVAVAAGGEDVPVQPRWHFDVATHEREAPEHPTTFRELLDAALST